MKCIDDGIREMLEAKLVMLTNLLSDRGISMTSQERNCIVDLDYDGTCYVGQSSISDESDDEDEDTDEDEDNESHCYICGSRDHTGFLDEKEHVPFCPNV